MTTRTYKDNLSLDGRLKVVNGVTARKVSAAKDLLEGHLRGDFIKSAQLREALTTSDAVFNLAHLATLNFVPNYDEAEREWSTIAGERTVPDLKPVTLYSLNKSWTDGNGESNVLGDGPNPVSPIVPEGSVYPYAYISGDVAQGASVVKRGFKTDWTLESRINDGLGAIEALPEEMRTVALDTEEADVFGALISQKTSASTLAGGPIPSGVTVDPNSALTRDAITRAVIELSERKINGRKIRVRGGYNLVVPTGQRLFVQFLLDQVLTKIHNGDLEFSFNGRELFAGLTVVESDFLTGTEWFLLPKKGTTARPVLERLKLRGYETPQLFVDNHVGQYVGSATVAPFEGSFDADVITLKLRQFGGGVLWDNGLGVVYSNGTGVA